MAPGDWLLGGVIAFFVAAITTPAGVSGAVFLLPVQVSVLHVPNPALTPTNLLYNVFATPGALVRFAREQRLRTPLARAMLVGTLPGVVIGAVLRVELLEDLSAFLIVVAAVLAPLGAWLAAGRSSPAGQRPPEPGRTVSLLALAAGVIGGAYGIGGGSLLGPMLAYMGFSLYVVAPAALTSTFLTSVAGVVTYQALELLKGEGTIAPIWTLGLSMGIGGICGSYLGARFQHRVPESVLRRLLGVICLGLSLRYLLQGTGVG